jgi:hypothetical protein
MTTRTFHVLQSGLTVPDGAGANRVAFRGETFTITPNQYEDSKDREGRSWLDSPGDRFAEGPAPADIALGEDDSSFMYRRREEDLAAARGIADPAERHAAVEAVHARYGRPMTSTSLGRIPEGK